MSSSSPTVFVLDADSLVRNMITDLARAMHLRCESFLSGLDFLEAFDVSRAGCLITEVRTPELGGLEVQRRLVLQNAPLPVVFLTAHATVPVIVRAMRMGATNFLEKPPSEHNLWEAIQEAIQEDERRRRVLESDRVMREMLDSLEPHEQKMLKLIAQGNTMREVSGELGVSVRTAEIRRSKMMEKLSLESQVDLLRFAFSVLEAEETEGGRGRRADLAEIIPRAKMLTVD